MLIFQEGVCIDPVVVVTKIMMNPDIINAFVNKTSGDGVPLKYESMMKNAKKKVKLKLYTLVFFKHNYGK